MISETCVLRYITNSKNENGFPVQTAHDVSAHCREKSAARTEFYDALRSGISVSLVLEVRAEDWELTKHTTANGKRAYATKALYDGGEYDIVRTYKPDKAFIQIVCS